MRVACFLAFIYMAWDCAEKALGVTPQHLFSQDAIWVWWIAAFGGVLAGIRVLLAGEGTQ